MKHGLLQRKDKQALYPKYNAKKSEECPYEVLETFLGKTPVGKKYEPLFPYYSQHENAFSILADYVTTDNGTGLVHQAPAFGEDDFLIVELMVLSS